MPEPSSSAPVAAGGEPNVLDAKTVPIIFVPGVMGSRLCRPNGDSLWDPDKPSSMLGLLTASAGIESIMLDAVTSARVMRTGASNKGVSEDENSRGWGGLAWDFYGNGLRFLQEQAQWKGNKCNVYACGYDWRQCNDTSGKRLRSFIASVLDKEPEAEKVILVTHSMGGLVARSACKNGAESKVAGVVHVVQPAVGAIAAYRRFKTGACTQFEDGDFGLTRILGNTPYKYQRILAGLLGPAQLMPSNDHPRTISADEHWLTASGSVKTRFAVPEGDIYDTYLENTGAVGVFNHSEDKHYADKLTKTINTARRFHQRLGLWKHPNTYVVAVDGYETDVACKFHMTDPIFGDPEVELDTDALEKGRGLGKGDKTVPLVSQTVLDVPKDKTHIFRDRSAPDHAGVFGSADINNKVRDFVRRIISSM